MADVAPTAPDLGSAVRSSGDGVALDVEVVPGAGAARFPAGWNPWRQRVGARVEAPPQDGRANAELVRLVAHFFGCPSRDVAVVAGTTSRQKTREVTGVDVGAVRRAIADGLATGPVGEGP